MSGEDGVNWQTVAEIDAASLAETIHLREQVARLTVERDEYKDAFDLQTAKNFSLSADLAVARAALVEIASVLGPTVPALPVGPDVEWEIALEKAKDILSRLGTGEALQAVREANLPAPEWEERAGAFWLTFRKDILVEPYLRSLGLNERQVKAVLHLKGAGRVTNLEYQRLFDVKKRAASDDLAELERSGLIERVGRTGRGTYYRLKRQERGERGTEGAPKGRNGQ